MVDRARDPLLRGDAEPEEDRDDHDRRDRVEDLERDVLALLARDVVVAPAEADGDVRDQPEHERAHGHRRHEEALPQRQHVGALAARGIWRAEGGELAPREQEGARDEHEAASHRAEPTRI